MVSVEMLKVPVFFNGDMLSRFNRHGWCQRPPGVLPHSWVPSNTPVGIKSCHFGVMGARLDGHPSACIPKTEAVPVTNSAKPTEIGKLTMFLGEYYHHIGFFPWPCEITGLYIK